MAFFPFPDRKLAYTQRMNPIPPLLPPSPTPAPPGAKTEPWLEVTCSRHFTAWMAEQKVSLACTTYQTAKLLLFGRKPDGELAVFERTFNRCMGLWGDGQTMWMSSLYQMWRLENVPRPGEIYQGHDRLYVPKVGHTTGDLDIHDIVAEPSGRVIFLATGFNCLATLNERLQLHAAMAAAVCEQAGRGGSLPLQWPGPGASRVGVPVYRDGGQHHGRRGRLARPQARRRRCV